MEKSSQVDTACPSTPTMMSPAFRPASAATDFAVTEADDDRVPIERGQLRALIQHHGHHQPGQRQVHDGAHHEHLESFPLRFRQKLVRGTCAVVFRILAGHFDVAAERDQAQAVLRVASGDRQELGPNPSRRRDADSNAARGQEMPQLVDERARRARTRRQRCCSLRTPRKPLL